MIKTYIVGLCTHVDDIHLVKVRSKDEVNAMCVAVRDNYNWDVLKETNGSLQFVTVDEAIVYFLQGGITITIPMEI